MVLAVIKHEQSLAVGMQYLENRNCLLFHLLDQVTVFLISLVVGTRFEEHCGIYCDIRILSLKLLAKSENIMEFTRMLKP